MSGGGQRQSAPAFLVLSEDGSEKAVPTLAALAGHMLRFIQPGVEVGEKCFEPPERRQRAALSGNRWLSVQPRDQRLVTDLVRLIAAHLLRPNGFVIFHFDGDLPYSQRASSERPRKFDALIRQKVRHLLSSRSQDEREAALSRLFLFVPFRDLEAWTYYNTSLLRLLCKPHEQTRVDRWAANPAALEEEDWLSKQLSVAKRHNAELAGPTYPARAALTAGKSFAAAADLLKANRTLADLMKELARGKASTH